MCVIDFSETAKNGQCTYIHAYTHPPKPKFLVSVRCLLLYTHACFSSYLASFSPIAGEDYITHSQFLTFTPTMTQFTFPLMIVTDGFLEDTERFFVAAELISMDAPGVVIDPGMTSVTIEDNDGTFV